MSEKESHECIKGHEQKVEGCDDCAAGFREVGFVSFRRTGDSYSDSLKFFECQSCFCLTLNTDHRCSVEKDDGSGLTDSVFSISMPVGTLVFSDEFKRDEVLRDDPYPGTVVFLQNSQTFWIFTGSFPWVQTDQYFRRINQ
jgi:hypothetical protein